MLERLRICLCHPKLIGSFYKDSFKKIFAVFFIMLSAFAAVFAVKAFTNDYFDDTDNKYIVSLIVSGDEKTTSYDSTTNKMTGAAKYVSNSIIVHFCPTEEASDTITGKYSIIFYEDYVEVKFSFFKLGSINYSELKNVESFKLSEIRQGSIKNQLAFEEMLTQVFDTTNTTYSVIYYVTNLLRAIGFYLVLVLVLFFLSSFINPTLTKLIRFKLVMYCCMIYFFGEIIAVMTGFNWLEYVAIVITSLYMFICMIHIVRVKR